MRDRVCRECAGTIKEPTWVEDICPEPHHDMERFEMLFERLARLEREVRGEESDG